VLLGGKGEDANVIGRLRRSFSHCTALSFRAGASTAPGNGLLVVDDDHPFAEVWDRATAARRMARR
jgi:hypothetical protein